MMLPGFRVEIARHHTGHKHSHPHSHDRERRGIETIKSGTREIQVVRRVLDANDQMAEANRERFAAKNVFVLNVMMKRVFVVFVGIAPNMIPKEM